MHPKLAKEDPDEQNPGCAATNPSEPQTAKRKSNRSHNADGQHRLSNNSGR
jgi:hypothetical protein